MKSRPFSPPETTFPLLLANPSMFHTQICQRPISARLKMSFHGEESLCVRKSHCCRRCRRKWVFFPLVRVTCSSSLRCLLLVTLHPSALGHWRNSVKAVCCCFLFGALIVVSPKRQKKTPEAIYHCQLGCCFPMMAAFCWWGFLLADVG